MAIRVPVARFEETVRALRDIGTVRSEGSTTRDVTEEFVDLEGRLRHLRREEKALLRLIDRARSVNEVLSVRRQLSSVQENIESATGQLRLLTTRTDFSAIDLRITEPGAAILEAADATSFSKACDTATSGLERIITGVMIGAIWLVPVAVLLALVLLVARLARPTRSRPEESAPR
jgi:hypothetical protein